MDRNKLHIFSLCNFTSPIGFSLTIAHFLIHGCYSLIYHPLTQYSVPPNNIYTFTLVGIL